MPNIVQNRECNNGIQYRTSLEDVDKHYTSLERAFEDGNYTYVATFAHDNAELRGSAYIMLGAPAEGIQILDDHRVFSYRSMVNRAFGYWCLDRKAEALSILQQLNAECFESKLHSLLSNLLRRDRINVLVVNKEFDFRIPEILVDFNVLTLGFADTDDIMIDFDFNEKCLQIILEQYDFKPDFIFVFRPEYHFLFKGFELLPYPKIAFCSDYDLHLNQKFIDIQKFNQLIVYSSVDHYEISRLFNKPTSTFIFSHTTGKKIKSGKERKKKIDVLLTGTTFKHFFADKSQFIKELTQVAPEYNVWINDGFVPPETYSRLLEISRVVPTFVRFYGCFPTRGAEALAANSSVLYQEKGVLELFFRQAVGLFPYRTRSVREDCEHAIVASENCRLTDEIHSGLLANTSSLAGLLRFSSFLSLRTQSNSDTSPLFDERHVAKVVGYHSLHGSLTDHITPYKTETNFIKMIRYNLELLPDKASFNALAISFVYMRQHIDTFLDHYNQSKKDWCITNALDAWERGLQQNPTSLAMRFNQARTCYHYGYIEEATQHFKAILLDEKQLEIDLVKDDLMSGYFFFDGYFPHRQYIDRIIACRIGGASEEPTRIVYSSVAYYLSKIYQQTGSLDKATTYIRLSLQYFPDNHISMDLFLQILTEKFRNTGDTSLLAEVPNLYEKSAAIYSRFLHDSIGIYAAALYQLGDSERLRVAMHRWYWFFKRVRENFKLLPISEAFLTDVMKYDVYLPQEARNVFTHIRHMLTHNIFIPLSSFEEEVLLAVCRRDSRLETLANLSDQSCASLKRPDIYISLFEYYAERKMVSRALTYYGLYYKAWKNADETDQLTSVKYSLPDVIRALAAPWTSIFGVLKQFYNMWCFFNVANWHLIIVYRRLRSKAGSHFLMLLGDTCGKINSNRARKIYKYSFSLNPQNKKVRDILIGRNVS